MKNYSVGIVGYGAVGGSMRELFPSAAIYDPRLGFCDRDGANRSDFAFVCVPTPSAADGSCDTSCVEETVRWLEAGTIVIRSTVAPGTTDRLSAQTGKRIVFQPEFGPGETPGHPYANVRNIGWAIFGGPRQWTIPVCDLYKRVVNSNLELRQTDALTAELTKYMENAFLATKVAFCNEFYDIATAAGVDYNELRELWLMDPRMGRSHTWVHPDDRGFGGRCLPKDLAAIIHTAETLGRPAELLTAVQSANSNVRGRQAP